MIIKYLKFNRKEAMENPQRMYIFTDSLMRSSGQNKVDEKSWYYKKYGPKRLYYPSITSSCVRGLDNAYPITLTKYHKLQGSYDKGIWMDEDFDLFKQVIDDDINKIKEDLDKYSEIILPEGGLFNRPHSWITKERTPRLFKYLLTKLVCLGN